MKSFFAVLLIASCGLCEAQTKQPRKTTAKSPATKTTAASAPADPSTWPLESFTVKGNRNYSRDQILALSGLKLGQPVTKADFDAARDRVVGSGAFLNVACAYEPASDNKGYAAIFEVTEVPEIYPLRVEDLPITDAELVAFAKQKDALAGPRIPGTKEALQRYQAIVAELLASKNYHEPVAGKLTSEIPPDLIVLFRPTAPRPPVAHVKFTGASVLPASTLQNKMLDVARGIGYSEAGFRQQLDANVRPLYDAIGRVKVSFPKITTEPDPRVKGLVVTVEVNEGPIYKLGKIMVIGAGTGPDRQTELGNLAKIKSGETANFDKVKEAAQNIEHLLRREGHLKASSTVDRRYDDATKTVDITLRMDPGPLFTFSKLSIVGLDIESEPVIRKMWGLAEGKPYNVDYPQHFLDRVKEDGVFENLKNTRFESNIDPDKQTIEVTLYFNEKQKNPTEKPVAQALVPAASTLVSTLG